MIGLTEVQLFCIVVFGISHLPFHIPLRFFMGLSSVEFAGQLRAGIPLSLNQVLVDLSVCRCQIQQGRRAEAHYQRNLVSHIT